MYASMIKENAGPDFWDYPKGSSVFGLFIYRRNISLIAVQRNLQQQGVLQIPSAKKGGGGETIVR